MTDIFWKFITELNRFSFIEVVYHARQYDGWVVWLRQLLLRCSTVVTNFFKSRELVPLLQKFRTYAKCKLARTLTSTSCSYVDLSGYLKDTFYKISINELLDNQLTWKCTLLLTRQWMRLLGKEDLYTQGISHALGRLRKMCNPYFHEFWFIPKGFQLVCYTATLFTTQALD